MFENNRPPAAVLATRQGGGTPSGRHPAKGTVVVTTTASDSHTWNLVYLQALVEELGYDVVNLGPCVPDDLLVDTCRDVMPSMVVVSSVNGHGYQDGLRVIGKLRACPLLVATPVVIGGKLGIASHLDEPQVGRLVEAGFDAVFQDGGNGVDFRRFVDSIPDSTRRLTRGVGIGIGV